jgi:hypothetical protein
MEIVFVSRSLKEERMIVIVAIVALALVQVEEEEVNGEFLSQIFHVPQVGKI